MTAGFDTLNQCIDVETAASIADGDASRAVRERALAHADTCEPCRLMLSALTRAAGEDELPVDPGLSVPETDRYLFGDEVGRGGLGRVVQAHDRRLDRSVAVKLLAADDPRARARFLREIRITARLQHPAIVPIYDAGTWGDGEPYYAMRLVAGETLHDAVGRADSFGARLGLVASVLSAAEAVAHAHGRGVIHRDLKPANVLVAELGETVVIDWGLAKAIDEDDGSLASLERSDTGDADGALTRIGAVMGTPAYMAPEQARGEPADARADVYALGAILYFTLTGRAPIEGNAATELLARKLTDMPTALAVVAPDTPAELAAIVDKAMALDPSARYPSARELALDLRRFTTGQLVGAARYTAWALVRRWLARHRAAVTVAAVLTAALIATGILSVRRIVAERTEAEARSAEARARSAELILANARGALDRDPTEALAWLKQYPDDATDWGTAAGIAADAVARGVASQVVKLPVVRIYQLAFSPDGKQLAVGSDAGVHLIDRDTGKVTHWFELWNVYAMRFTLDGALVGAAQEGVLFEARLGAPARRWRRPGDADVLSFAVSSNQRYMALVDLGGSSLLVDRDTGEQRSFQPHRHLAFAAAFGADDSLFTAGQDGVVNRMDVSGTVLAEAELGGPVHYLLPAPEGGVVAALLDGRIVRWGGSAATTGEVVAVADGGIGYDPVATSRGVAFRQRTSPTVRLLEADANHSLAHEAGVSALAPGDGNVSLISGDSAGNLYLWSGTAREILRGHRTSIVAAAQTAGGDWYASASDDAQVRLWNRPRSSVRVLGPLESQVFELGFGPDGSVFVGTMHGALLRWGPGTSAAELLDSFDDRAYELDVRGGKVACAGWDGKVLLWQPGVLTRTMEHGAVVTDVVFSPDGSLLASSGEDGSVKLWESGTGELLGSVGRDSAVRDLAFERDGGALASTWDDGKVRVFSVGASGAQRLTERWAASRPGVSPLTVVFLSDGRVATGANDGQPRIWSHDGAVALLPTPGHAPTRVALDPTGRWLASGNEEGTVQLVELATGRARVARAHATQVRDLAFSPDGRLLATAGWDGAVHVWGVHDDSRRRLLGHVGRVHGVRFSGDSRLIASSGADATVRVWSSDDGRAINLPLRPELAALTAARLENDTLR